MGVYHFGLHGPHLKKKNSLRPRINYYYSNDVCYSKKIVNNVEIRTLLFLYFILSIVIGIAASLTSKGPRVKTTERMVSIKITNCSIQLG